MPTTKPRITITLDEDTHELFKAFAAAQGRSMSSVISEMLKEVSPPIARTLSLLLVAKDAPKQVLDDLTSTFEAAANDARGHFGDSVNQMDLLLEELQRRASNPPSSNTGATTEPPAPTLPESGTSRG
jgi:uncharacterized protein (DUF1778 family)